MKRSVMILEDDEDLLETIALFLQEEGFVVYKSASKDEFDQKIKEVTPSAFILDVRLPDGSGGKVAEKIKKSKDLKNASVFLISAGDNLAKIARECGADYYFKKPFSFSRLLEALS